MHYEISDVTSTSILEPLLANKQQQQFANNKHKHDRNI